MLLCGFGWDGIGINDMTRSARQAIRALDQHGADSQAPEPASGDARYYRYGIAFSRHCMDAHAHHWTNPRLKKQIGWTIAFDS